MDPWGDPWADDGDASSPPKEEVTKPPSAPLAAPVLLNGFLDDAQWGEFGEEEDSRGWATAEPADNAPASIQETRVPEAGPDLLAARPAEALDHVGHWEEEDMSLENQGWGKLDVDTEESGETENVVSEASDSATIIQPDHLPQRIPTDVSEALQPDDDLSTRPSTSPSDASHAGLPTESPRTSFEDESAPIDDDVTIEQATEAEEAGKERSFETDNAAATSSEGTDGDDFGDFEEDHTDKVEPALKEQLTATQAPSVSEVQVTEDESNFAHVDATGTSLPVTTTATPSFVPDLSLTTHLFPPPKDTKEPAPAPEDLISSTSTRKAWYRLTRKQTMREYNSGGDEDNYVRVTWANSKLSSDVGKIVSRWATEDRMAGRGPGGGASFYWDKAPQPEKKPLHIQKKASISLSPAAPAKPSVHPLSTNVPAAFNWSSTPLASHDPWKEESPSLRAVSSPMTVKPVQKDELRSTSLDMTRRDSPQPSQEQTASLISPGIVEEISVTPPLVLPGPSKAVRDPDPWSSLAILDTNPPAPPQEHISKVDDDDEWGEMVESPAVSNPIPVEEIPSLDSRQQTLSTPSTTPKSVRTSPFQPPLSKHASPIVRLKGTVSPTSALFQPNAFIPTNSEGPVGPSLLKRSNRSREATPERVRQTSQTPSIDHVISEPPKTSDTSSHEHNNFSDVNPSTTDNSPVSANHADDFADFESSIPQPAAPEPSRPSTPTFPPPVTTSIPSSPIPILPTSPSLPAHSSPPPPPHAPPPTAPPDPWSTADFSIFDSAPRPSVSSSAIPTSAPAPAPDPSDPSDPFSIFSSPAPPTPRELTPPPKMPLTAASNSAQRRKAEEDEVVRRIVEGLPDLGYMLRR
jgi:hypothetical protein